MISIVTDIAMRCPRTYQHWAAITSHLLAYMGNKNKKEELVLKIIKKFDDIPNTEFLTIWIQRIALGSQLETTFNEPLCCLASKSENDNSHIWESSWIDCKSLKKAVNEILIVDQNIINKLPEKITQDEVSLFNKVFLLY